MADATPLNSGLLTDLNAVPAVKHDPIDFGGVLREVAGTLTLTAAQVTAGAIGDTWAIVRVPTRARIDSVFLTSDKLDSNVSPTLKVDLGVYLPNQPGVLAATGSDTLYLSAATTFQAAVLSVDQSLSIVASKVNQPRWSLGGAASDPGGFYDIAFKLTAVAATGAAGSITLQVSYVDAD